MNAGLLDLDALMKRGIPGVAQTPGSGGLLGIQSPMQPISAGTSAPPEMAQGAPPMAAPHQSLLDRIRAGVGRVGSLLDPRPSAPDGYDGLLSGDEIKHARPSFLHSIIGAPGGPSADEQYQDNLNRVLEMKQYKTGLTEQQRIMEGRRTMANRFQLNPNASQEESNRLGEAMYLDRVRAGDFAGAKALESFAGQAAKTPASGAARDAQVVHNALGAPGGPNAGKPVTAFYNATTHALEKEVPETAGPVSEETILQHHLANDARDAAAAALKEQRANMLAAGQARVFATQNKPLVDSNVAYTGAKNAFIEARSGNPAALKSALIAYAGVADPKAQLRQGVINMISQVDPSVKGRWDLALARLDSGRLPPYIIDNMEKLVERTHKTNMDVYEQRRQGAVRRNPALENEIPTTADTFTMPDVPAGASGVRKVRF